TMELNQDAFNSNRILSTSASGSPIYSRINISNALHNLSITDESGQVIQISHENANILIKGGVVHKISSIIKSE
ncbi:MAG: hypothetical protein HC906_00290, partial [Bacteroidales bacterium]|nr:hypothetical protein [Bacteroidales bacterium]